jgi:hypothetical protein
MKTKKLTFLLSLTFLFLFSGSVYGEEPEVKKEFYDSGELKKETHYKNGKKEGLEKEWFDWGEIRTNYKNGKKEGLETLWFESGKKKYEYHWKNGIENGKNKEWDRDGSPQVANKSFSNFDVQGLDRDDERHSVEYKRSFCGQYSMRIISADSNEVMDKILSKTSNLNKLPTYGSAKFGHPYSIILSNNSNPLIIFKGVYITLKCEDITGDGNPELFASINYAGGNASVTQYIFSMDEFNLLLDTSESGVTWYDGGLHQKMEDLDGDGVKEYNGWRHYWDLLNVCSACRVPPRKIMCLNGKSYIDCTKKFPELLQKDLNESREKLRSPSDNLKNDIDQFHTELIFFIATSINLDKKEESLDYIKTNFSQETFDWVKENMDKILKELDS